MGCNCGKARRPITAYEITPGDVPAAPRQMTRDPGGPWTVVYDDGRSLKFDLKLDALTAVALSKGTARLEE